MAFRNWKQELEDKRPPAPSPWPFVVRCAAALAALAGLAAGALWVWPGYLLPKPWVRPGPAPKNLTLVFSSDLRGHIEPCGCTEQRWGGVARLAGFVRTLSNQTPQVLVDVGNMTAGPEYWRQVGLEFYLSALGELHYTAANLGSAEAAMSADQLAELVRASPVPLVSANLLNARTGLPLAAPYRQVLVSNLRVTVVGVLQAEENVPCGAGVAVGDVDACLGKLLPTLRPHTDVLVLLASCSEAQLADLARRHPELDAALGGRVSQANREIEIVGTCRLAYQANKGQMLGRMNVQIHPDGRCGVATSVMTVLDNDVSEDPAMVDLAERYNARLADLSRQSGPAALGVVVAPRPAGTNAYVGSEACRPCHAKAYDVWKASRHARAYSSLVRRKRDSNPDCVSCHVTGMGSQDGFVSLAASSSRLDVQCESCHSRGADHVRARTSGSIQSSPPSGSAREAGKMAPVLPKSCEACHDCIRSPQFTYETYWEKIKHE